MSWQLTFVSVSYCFPLHKGSISYTQPSNFMLCLIILFRSAECCSSNCIVCVILQVDNPDKSLTLFQSFAKLSSLSMKCLSMPKGFANCLAQIDNLQSLVMPIYWNLNAGANSIKLLRVHSLTLFELLSAIFPSTLEWFSLQKEWVNILILIFGPTYAVVGVALLNLKNLFWYWCK